jgi:H+/Cl- antiporter ClcA
MVGYLTGMTQTPLTASVIVLEMAAAHEMILPIMAAALLAMGSSRTVCRESIYEALAHQFEVQQPLPGKNTEQPPSR